MSLFLTATDDTGALWGGPSCTRFASFWQLAPLTDPRAAEFIADIERFAVVSRPKEIA